MSEKSEEGRFRSFLEKTLAPVIVLLYFLSFVVKLHEYTDKIGLKVVACAALVLVAIWVIYVFFSKKTSPVTDTKTARFPKGDRTRLLSLGTLVLSVLPVVWLFFPRVNISAKIEEQDRFKTAFQIRIHNKSNIAAVLSDLYLKPETRDIPLRKLVDSKLIPLAPEERRIPPGKELLIWGRPTHEYRNVPRYQSIQVVFKFDKDSWFDLSWLYSPPLLRTPQ